MTALDYAPPARRLALDKLGILIAGLSLAGLFSPFMLFRANRIVPGNARSIVDSLMAVPAGGLYGLLALAIVLALLRTDARLRLLSSLAALVGLLIALGLGATHLTPVGDRLARVSPASGFWILLFAFALLAADSLTRLRPGPWVRLLLLAGVAAGLAVLLVSGVWRDVSVLKEYGNRAASFWQEGRTHVLLAFGSVVLATICGIPLGILCHRVRPLRAGVLNVLNIVQTIPSIALFGLLIAPLAWVAANIPGASALGISGIGVAPAMVALFGYSLLPVVSNTVVGLAGVPASANEAAIGMGMTGAQRLRDVEFPLAFPVILTGIRIVLVQNIGMATIAALIGGGGFGVFVFQGVGQTAMDLVLLGAVPTVALAFAAAVVMDALVELTRTPPTRRNAPA